MIHPITLLSAGICLWVLYLGARGAQKNQTKSTVAQRLKTVKILIVALLGLMAIRYSMLRAGDKLDRKTHDATLVERVVTFFAK